MNRLQALEEKVRALYEARSSSRADWADWLYEQHVFVVVREAGILSLRFGAQKDLVQAAAMLHDVADAVMSRFDPKHEEESIAIARRLLLESRFSEDEIIIVVDDALRFHSCREGERPSTLEGKLMATADAVAHLTSDYYERARALLQEEKTLEEIQAWALPKIERDFYTKIFFDEIREEVRKDYDRVKRLFV